MSSEPLAFELSCPAPKPETERVLLAHGSGGLLTSQLIEQMVVPVLRNPALEVLDDQAVLAMSASVAGGGARIAFTTDSYVVTPLFFPGGDIGELAVNGTINDLAMGGARPLAPAHRRPRRAARAAGRCRRHPAHPRAFRVHLGWSGPLPEPARPAV